MIVLLAVESLDGYGQKVDSLKSLLVNKTGVERANILYQLAYEYVDFDYEQAKKYAIEAFIDANIRGDSLLYVKAGRISALALARNNQGDSSIDLSLEILPVARRNMYDSELKYILNRLGMGYLHKGKYDSSLIYHFESLSLREKYCEENEISVTLNNIGLVYYTLKNYDKALSFYRRSEEIKKRTNSKEALDLMLLNISLCYAYKDQFGVASEYVNRAYELCGKNCSDGFLMLANFNLALISKGLNQLDDAERQFSKSFLLSKELGNVRFQLENLVYLLEIARMTNSLESRERLLAEADALLDEDVSYRLVSMKLCHELFDAYGALHNSQKMSYYQSKYIQLKDSTFNEENTRNLMKVEADYMEQENKAKLEAQEKILVISKDTINRQRVLNVVIGLVAVLSVVLVFVLVQNVKNKKHANVLLEQKVKERTMELEVNHNELLKSMEERNQQIKRISAEVKSSMATIRGLCKLSLQDVSVVNAGQYIDKIERASDHLQSGIHRTLGINENGIS